MPDRGSSSAAGPLTRVVAALNAAAPELDGTAIAECLWLASVMDTSAAPPTPSEPQPRLSGPAPDPAPPDDGG